jgi:N-acetylglutamate synthase-like GNAT family acetyltransferase
MVIEYRPIQVQDYEKVRQFLSELGWQNRMQDPSRFQKMMDRADRTIVAFEGTRVVGFGRALCDGVSNGYLSMIAVAADKRKQGIGRELVRRLMAGDEEGQITWVLRAGRNSGAFWRKLGFTESQIAMERTRRLEVEP